MTLVELDNGQRILIDIHVRSAADDEGDETPDVMGQLRDRLDRDGQGRLYVDAFLLSHPDKDHINGLEKHFHLGSPANWVADDDKILINEMWSSPLVFRRADETEVADGDPKAWWDEARRRVARFRDNGLATEEGERIVILGEDCDGKTDDLGDIVVEVGTTFSKVDRVDSDAIEVFLLGPINAEDEEEAEEFSKNDSSVVSRFAIRNGESEEPFRFLTGGDAGVAIWEKLWEIYGDTDALDYDMLQTPHHCSWHSLSYDSYSDYGEEAEVNDGARSALGQALDGAYIIASSKAISPDDGDPPSDRARREYVDILGDDGRFICVADHWENDETPLVFQIDQSGLAIKADSSRPLEFKSAALAASAAVIGISAEEQKARALSAASAMKQQGTASKPYACDEG